MDTNFTNNLQSLVNFGDMIPRLPSNYRPSQNRQEFVISNNGEYQQEQGDIHRYFMLLSNPDTREMGSQHSQQAITETSMLLKSSDQINLDDPEI